MQLSFSSENNGAPTNKVTVRNIGISFNPRLTWIKLPSFTNDSLTSGQVTLLPESPFRMNALNTEDQYNHHVVSNRLREEMNSYHSQCY